MENKVSIIMPLYNSKKYVKESIDSVITQTYQNWELLITDDCSSDGSYEYVKELIKDEPRARIFKLDKNSGAAIARNNSIEKSSGRFVAFLDSDDLWNKDKLEKQVQFMLDNDIAFSYTNYTVYSEEKQNNRIEFIGKKRASYKSLLGNCYIGCLTAMYDVEKVDKVYMPTNAIKREDYAAWLKILKQGIIAFNVNLNLATYRLVDGSVSSKKAKMIKYQWNLFRNVENLNWFKSVFYVFKSIVVKLFKY